MNPSNSGKKANFKSGESVLTELEYEKLLKDCFTCKRLTHDINSCPFKIDPKDTANSREDGADSSRWLKAHDRNKEKEGKQLSVIPDDIPRLGKITTSSHQSQPSSSIRRRSFKEADSKSKGKGLAKKELNSGNYVWMVNTNPSNSQ